MLRKLKWMVINILFPEFILSKAVCDLRLALYELLEFDAYLREHKKDVTWTMESDTGDWIESLDCSWKIETLSGWSCVLYDLFRLPRRLSLPKQPDEHLHQPDTASSSTNEEDNSKRINWRDQLEQTWTITHSYYARMGGLVSIYSVSDLGTIRIVDVVTTSKLTSWKTENPLRHLILGKEDIEDKSKADWFLKTLAILQVAWLVLNVIVRHATGLPITQLEVATVAFAIMAVLSYLANWWKPKDVSRPTVMGWRGEWRGALGERSSQSTSNHLQSFTQRLRAPAEAGAPAASQEGWVPRIANDVVWLEGETPLLYYLLAGSSLVFGGLHCLAWDFEFPTRVELICWRAASVTSALLPVVTLAISAFLDYVATSYLRKEFKSKWLAELDNRFVEQPQSRWWDSFLQPQFLFSDWDKASLYDLYTTPTESRNWEKPSPPGDRHGSVDPPRYFLMFTHYLRTFLHALASCRAGTATLHQFARLTSEGKTVRFLLQQDQQPQLPEFWKDYENFARRKLGNFKLTAACGETATCLEEILKVTENTTTWTFTLEKRFRRVSNAVFIIGLILYAASRLIILIILFTSLRAAPAAVYQNTVWTRFLPSFS